MTIDLMSAVIGLGVGAGMGAALAWPRGFLKGDAYGRAAILEKLSATLKRPVKEGSFPPGGGDDLEQIRRQVAKTAASSHGSDE